jgi:hypothetical protein
MASLPLSGGVGTAHAEVVDNRQRMAVMDLFVVLFFALIALASALGLVADSRDSADWKPTSDGGRTPRWP